MSIDKEAVDPQAEPNLGKGIPVPESRARSTPNLQTNKHQT